MATAFHMMITIILYTYICVYMCVCAWVYTCEYACRCKCVCVCIFVCICVFVSVYVCICVFVYVFSFVFMWLYVYVCIFVYMHVYVYVCKFKENNADELIIVKKCSRNCLERNRKFKTGDKTKVHAFLKSNRMRWTQKTLCSDNRYTKCS